VPATHPDQKPSIEPASGVASPLTGDQADTPLLPPRGTQNGAPVPSSPNPTSSRREGLPSCTHAWRFVSRGVQHLVHRGLPARHAGEVLGQELNALRWSGSSRIRPAADRRATGTASSSPAMAAPHVVSAVSTTVLIA
jgi:hypothetical protein